MKNMKTLKTGMLIALMAVVALGIAFGVSSASRISQTSAVAAESNNSGVMMVPINFSDIAEKARPGVVNISVV